MSAADPPRPPTPVRLADDGRSLVVLDQTALPGEERYLTLSDVAAVEEAIVSLRVRGAPLLGIVAALALAALARRSLADDPSLSVADLAAEVHGNAVRLAEARPTAVNLPWACRRMRQLTGSLESRGATAEELVEALTAEAEAILEKDRSMCRAIGEHALSVVRDAARILTHCNAGALATGGVGTALAPIYLRAEDTASGPPPRVWVGETRPLLQGSRLTAWELGRAGVDVTVMSDGTAGALFASEPPDAVLVGADRIAANGDVANKVGTYGLAVLAHHHRVPFLVLAPTTTVDLDTPSGADIPIEHRSGDELTRGLGRVTAPAGAAVLSPAFDVTPASLITAIVTEAGVHRPPFADALRRAVAAAEGPHGPEGGPP